MKLNNSIRKNEKNEIHNLEHVLKITVGNF